MNTKSKQFVKNFSYAFSSNLLLVFISMLVLLVVPKVLGVQEYGYWQIYLFYSSYVGFLHFGWNDGIYLKYGGELYSELKKDILSSQFWLLLSLQIFLGIFLAISSILITSDENRIFIIKMIAICMSIVNIRYMLIYLLQATNRIKEYSTIIIFEKILYSFLISILLIFGVRNFELLIFSDIIGKFLSLLLASYYCKDIVFSKIREFNSVFKEAYDNITIGIKLMFANIASILIIGVVRFGIERTWDVSTFGKISLTLSVSNLIMIFINSIGIVVFPVLKRAKEENLSYIYNIMRSVLMIPLLGILITYYPLKFALMNWLPLYAESLKYMAILFPMCVYEGKMALLINTYLKILRREKLLLVVNIASLGLSIVLTFIFTVIYENLTLAIGSIIFLLAFRGIVAEIFISKILNIFVIKDLLIELGMVFLFISASWYIESWHGAIVYVIGYMIYLLVNRKEIKGTLMSIRLLIKVE